MKRWATTKTTVAGVLAACLLCCATAEAKKGGNGGGGGGGGGETAPYTLVDLEGFPVDVPGGHTHFQSYALSLNEPDNIGGVQVVGYAFSEKWPGSLKSPTLWDVNADGSFAITNLGLESGETAAFATDVNDLEVITISTHGSTNFYAGGTNTILPAWVLPAPGQPRLLLAIQGTQGEALAINNLGDIAGSDHNRSPTGVAWQLADPATDIDLGLFAPSDIDESGVMAGLVGWSSRAPAIAWFDSEDNLQVQELEFLSLGSATAISPDGTWVAGWIQAGGTEEAFVWSVGDGMIPLGTLGGESSGALGVNNTGQVVGWSDTGDNRDPRTAFLWQDGQMFDLDSLADTGGKIQLMEAAEINNSGHVVGYMKVSVKGSNDEHAFVLIPNEP